MRKELIKINSHDAVPSTRIITNNRISGRLMRITMLIAICGIVCFSPNNMAMAQPPAQCPDPHIISPDCPIPFTPGGTRTIEYPEGSDCRLTFNYCYRYNCDGFLDIYIGAFQSIGQECDGISLELDLDKFRIILNSILPEYISEIPPCNDNDFYQYVRLYTAACGTDQYIEEIYLYPAGYISNYVVVKFGNAICNINALCVHNFHICWEYVPPGVYATKIIEHYKELAELDTCIQQKLYFLSAKNFIGILDTNNPYYDSFAGFRSELLDKLEKMQIFKLECSQYKKPRQENKLLNCLLDAFNRAMMQNAILPNVYTEIFELFLEHYKEILKNGGHGYGAPPYIPDPQFIEEYINYMRNKYQEGFLPCYHICY